MQRDSDLEEELLASMRSLTSIANVFGNNTASTRFFTATSRLPIPHLGFWESVVRRELDWAPNPLSAVNLRVSRRPHGPWLNLFSGDGFRRERALRVITSGAPNGFLFAAMLRRLNDWVPQVRAAARQSVARIAAKTDVEVVVDTLWGTLPNLHSLGRWDESDMDTLIDLVSVGDVPCRLASRIMSSPSGPAATILNQACRRKVMDAHLPKIAAESVQPAVRARAYRIIFEGQAYWLEGRQWVWTDRYWCKGKYEPVLGKREIDLNAERLPMLRNAIADRSPAVRRVAASALIARLGELGGDALTLAEHLATDRYPSVAERGRFALGRIADAGDVRAHE